MKLNIQYNTLPTLKAISVTSLQRENAQSRSQHFTRTRHNRLSQEAVDQQNIQMRTDNSSLFKPTQDIEQDVKKQLYYLQSIPSVEKMGNAVAKSQYSSINLQSIPKNQTISSMRYKTNEDETGSMLLDPNFSGLKSCRADQQVQQNGVRKSDAILITQELISEEQFQQTCEVRKQVQNHNFVAKLDDYNNHTADLKYDLTVKGNEVEMTQKASILKDLTLHKKDLLNLFGPIQNEFLLNGKTKPKLLPTMKIDKKREDLNVLQNWMHEEVQIINKEKETGPKNDFNFVLSIFDKLQYVYNHSMKEFGRQLQLVMKNYGDFLFTVWNANDEIMSQVICYLKNNYFENHLHHLSQSSHYHGEYQNNIINLEQNISTLESNLSTQKELYKRQVVTDRYMRKKMVRLEKKNKLTDYELRDIVKLLEELKLENFRLNTSITMMDENEEINLRLCIQKFQTEFFLQNQQYTQGGAHKYKQRGKDKDKDKEKHKDKGKDKQKDTKSKDTKSKNGSPKLDIILTNRDSDLSSINDDIENEMLTRNDADNFQIGIDIVEIGVNTSFLSMRKQKETVDQCLDTIELQRRYYRNHKETQMSAITADVDIQCELPIWQKEVFKKNDKFIDGLSNDLASILNASSFIPQGIVDSSRIFLNSERLVKGELQKIFCPPLEIQFTELQKVALQLFHKLEETYKDSHTVMLERDHETNDQKEQINYFQVELSKAEAKISKILLQSSINEAMIAKLNTELHTDQKIITQYEETLHKLQSKRDSRITSLSYIPNQAIKPRASVQVEQRNSKQFVPRKSRQDPQASQQQVQMDTRMSSIFDPNMIGSAKSPNLLINLDPNFNLEDETKEPQYHQVYTKSGVDGVSKLQKNNSVPQQIKQMSQSQKIKYDKSSPKKNLNQILQNQSPSQSQNQSMNQSINSTKNNSKLMTQKSTKQLFEPNKSQFREVREVKNDYAINKTADKFNKSILEKIQDEQEAPIDQSRKPTPNGSQNQGRFSQASHQASLSQQSVESGQQNHSKAEPTEQSIINSRLNITQPAAVQNSISIRVTDPQITMIQTIPLLEVENQSIVTQLNMNQGISKKTVQSNDLIIEENYNQTSSDNKQSITDNKLSGSGEREKLPSTSIYMKKLDISKIDFSRPASSQEEIQRGHRKKSDRLSTSTGKDEEQREKKRTNFKPFSFASMQLKKRKRDPKLEIKLFVKEAMDLTVKMGSPRIKRMITQQAMILMDQTLGPIKKIIYQVFSEIQAYYKRDEEIYQTLEVYIYEWFKQSFGLKKIAESKFTNMLQKLKKFDLSYYPLLQVALELMGTKYRPSLQDLTLFMYIWVTCEQQQKLHIVLYQTSLEQKSPLVVQSVELLKEILAQFCTPSTSQNLITQVLSQYVGQMNSMIQGDPNLQNTINFSDFVSKFIFDGYLHMVDLLSAEYLERYKYFIDNANSMIGWEVFRTLVHPLCNLSVQKLQQIFQTNCESEEPLITFRTFSKICEQQQLLSGEKKIMLQNLVFTQHGLILKGIDDVLQNWPTILKIIHNRTKMLDIQNHNYDLLVRNYQHFDKKSLNVSPRLKNQKPQEPPKPNDYRTFFQSVILLLIDLENQIIEQHALNCIPLEFELFNLPFLEYL